MSEYTQRLEELKEWFNNDGEMHQFQIEWLIEQAEKIAEINEEATAFWEDDIDLMDFGERVLSIISER